MRSARPRGRPWRWLLPLQALVWWPFVLACSPVPPHPQTQEQQPPPPVDDFSPALATAHFEALAQAGDRAPDSAADAIARAYLERELRLVGARTESIATRSGEHLFAEISGRSRDVVMLVVPYDTLGRDDRLDDSGAVVLLELARVFAQERPAYTLWLALAQVRPTPPGHSGAGEISAGVARVSAAREVTEASQPGAVSASARPLAEARTTRLRLAAAGRSLASALALRIAGVRVRAVVAIEPRARSEARIGRDLASHPVFRDLFWQVADRLGYDEVFSPEATWTSPRGVHTGFRELGVGPVLALVDETASRIERAANEPLGETVPAGLEAVGRVAVHALSIMLERFEKVDAFSR